MYIPETNKTNGEKVPSNIFSNSVIATLNYKSKQKDQLLLR